jgi:hypothetical protein
LWLVLENFNFTYLVAYHFAEDDTYLVVYKDGQYTVDPKSDIARDDARRSTSFAAYLSGWCPRAPLLLIVRLPPRRGLNTLEFARGPLMCSTSARCERRPFQEEKVPQVTTIMNIVTKKLVMVKYETMDSVGIGKVELVSES